MKRISLLTLVFLSMPTLMRAAELRVPQDHRTIQAAINAAKPGDAVLVSPGEYDERITLKPRVLLRSVGDDTRGKVGLKRAEQTVIKGPKQGGHKDEPGDDGALQPVVTMVEDAILDGFTITADGEYDDQAWRHHHKTQGNEQKHEHIGHFGSPGIGVRGVSCDVRNNIVHHIGSTGIAIAGEKGKRTSPRITANVCYRNMGGGIGSMNGSTAIIDGNTCYENFYAGIGHDNASPYVINNVCYGNIRAGIGISEGACPVVRHNKCYKNRRAGIGTRTGGQTRPVIEKNETYSNDMAGIGTDEKAEPIIRDNHVHDNALAGIGCQHGAKPIIIKNKSWNNGAAGIGARDGARPIIIGNESKDNASAGIGLRTKSPAVVLRNTCSGNKLVALGMPEGGSALIAENHFERTGGMPPLIAIRGGAKAVMIGNTIQGGGVAGVLVQGEVTLFHNTFDARKHGRLNRAVWGWKGSTIRMTANTTHNYKQAINAAGCAVSVIDNEIHGFENVAIQVTQSSQPPRVVGNVGDSENVKAQVVKSDDGIVSDNRLIDKAGN